MNRITLHALNGSLEGKQWEFDETTLLIAGREDDCGLRVPEEAGGVSRQHCLFDINPPRVAVRDLGSLNGTYVNGQCIGQRDEAMTPQDEALPLHPLKHGDEVRLGQTGLALRVEIIAETAARCVRCGKAAQGGNSLCESCRRPDNLRAILQQEARREPVTYPLGEYEAFEQLTGAGCSQVFRARDGRGQLVIVKALAIRQPDRVPVLEREINVMQVLEHPHVVRLIKSWRDDEKAMLFIAMEHCNGGNLDELARAYHKRSGQWLPAALAVPLIIQALEGLHYAHHEVVLTHEPEHNGQHPRGVVHRDIKPANLMMTVSPASASHSAPSVLDALIYGGQNTKDTAAWLAKNVAVKVGDFGLSKSYTRAGQSHMTALAEAYGTASFMARRQLLDYRFVRPSADVWSMAATLYWMLSGATPRNFPRGVEVHQAMQLPAVPLGQRNAAIPARLCALLDEALEENEMAHATEAAPLQTAQGLKQALLSLLPTL